MILPDSFLHSLPIEFPIWGHCVRLRLRQGGQVGIKVSPETDDNLMPASFEYPPDLPVDSQEILKFLGFYVNTQVGPAMLTFDKQEDEFEYRLRLRIIHYSFVAWQERDVEQESNGRLKKPVLCIGYTKGSAQWANMGDPGAAPSLCGFRTRDPSGLCHRHNKPGARTLWNYEPFPDRARIRSRKADLEVLYHAWRQQEANRERREREKRVQEEGERQARLEADRARRAREWKDVAARISYTATDRQIHFLLDLGAQPAQLEGIDTRQASDLIGRLLRTRSDRQ